MVEALREAPRELNLLDLVPWRRIGDDMVVSDDRVPVVPSVKGIDRTTTPHELNKPSSSRELISV